MESFINSWYEELDALFRDFAQTLEGLPTEALDWSPGADMSSLAVLAVHTCGSTRYRVYEVCLAAPNVRDRPAEFETRGCDAESLQARLRATLEEIRAVLAQLAVLDATAMREMPGRDMEVSVAAALLQALAHAAQHLGHAQLTRQLQEQRGDRDA